MKEIGSIPRKLRFFRPGHPSSVRAVHFSSAELHAFADAVQPLNHLTSLVKIPNCCTRYHVSVNSLMSKRTFKQ